MFLHLKRTGLVAAFVTMASAAFGQPLQDITIGLSAASFATAPTQIAKEMGLYEKHGLNAKIIVMQSGNAALSALLGKSVTFALAGSSEFIAARARGQKIVTVDRIYGGSSAYLVLAKSVVDKLGISPDAPLNDRLKALSGLVIASPSPTSTYTLSYRLAAKAAGVEFRSTYMDFAAMNAALETGAIQGYVGSAPFWVNPVLKGLAVMWVNGPRGDLPTDYSPVNGNSLQAMQDFAEANRDLIGKLRAVIAELRQAVKDRPAEVKAVLAKMYPSLTAEMIGLLFASESRGWIYPPITAADIKHDIDFTKATGAPLPELDTLDPAALLYKP